MGLRKRLWETLNGQGFVTSMSLEDTVEFLMKSYNENLRTKNKKEFNYYFTIEMMSFS